MNNTLFEDHIPKLFSIFDSTSLTICFVIILFFIILFLIYYRENESKIKYDDFEYLMNRIDELNSNTKTLFKYHNFISNYYNDDWNRDNPF